MIFSLMLKGLAKGRARFACAVLGVAISAGTIVFSSSLAATNRAQGPMLAERASAPWAAWKVDGIATGFGRGAPQQKADAAPNGEGRGMRGPRPDLRLKAVDLEVDYREGGRVLQGPPMRVLLASDPAGIPYAGVRLAEGRWVDENSSEPEIVCVRNAMRRFGRGKEPELNSQVVFTFRERGQGQMGPNRPDAPPPGGPASAKGQKKLVARVVGYMDGGKLPSTFPAVFGNKAAIETLPESAFGSVSFWKNRPGEGECLTPSSPEVVAGFTGDEQRRMDYATPLMTIASILTAVALLVLSLLLSVESNRKTLSTMRTVGLTRGGVVWFVFLESLFAGLVGWIVGTVGALLILQVYAAADTAAFPAGAAFDAGRILATLCILPFVVGAAVLFALAPALRVRGMDASASRPRRHYRGMAVTFALGFAAFVAVEVWGASLMRSFIPSPEWPDAIVSILPQGVRSSSAVLDPMRRIEGVKRISELYPLQVPLAVEEGEERSASQERGGRRFGAPNILFLAAEWLPEFKYVEGSHEEAERLWREGKGVVISEITSRANNLHRGDELAVKLRGRRGGPEVVKKIPVVGVADLNWHMVTSRGLVRGLNGMPVMTEGPAFISFDAIADLDPMSMMVGPSIDSSNPEVPGEGEKPMTHLWVEYEKDFLAKHGVFEAGRLIERCIDESLGHPGNSTVQLHARDEIADGTLAHGSDIIGQVARIPFVFLAILALGFVAMLVAEAEASRPEFAVLRAVGATRLQLAARLASSALRTALLGILAGLPVGALAGWIASLRTGAMFRGLHPWFVLPADVVAEGAIGAVVFALVFAIPTAILLVVRSTRR